MNSSRYVASKIVIYAAVAMLMLASVASFVALSVKLNFLSDDAFILFRYARNLARGEGLVFNPGERVEGYTSFLSVVVIAGLHRLGVDPVTAGRALSLAGGAATVLGTFLLGCRLLPGRALLPVGAAVLVAMNPYVAAWGGAGLETTLFSALLVFTALPLAAGEITARRFLAASALGLMLSLTRPEGVAIYGTILLMSLAAATSHPGERVRALLPGFLLFVLVGGAYFACRWNYFGYALPNTFYAKSAFSWNHVVRGGRYLVAFAAALPIVGLLPLALLGVVVSVRRRLFLPLALLLLILVVVVGEGGDGLPMYRFLVPAVPLIAVLFVLGLDGVVDRLGRRFGLAAAAVALAAVSFLSFFPPRDMQYRMFVNQREREIPRWRSAGQALARIFPSDTVIAAVPIGAVAYYSDLRTIDLLGLTDREIAHSYIPELGSGHAGHEKHNSRSVLSRRPDLLLLGDIFVSNKPALPPGIPLQSTIVAERELVREPGFTELYVQEALPMGDGRFLHLYVRRDYARSRG
jgi:arabinofuranosyltransferase